MNKKMNSCNIRLMKLAGEALDLIAAKKAEEKKQKDKEKENEEK